MRTAAAYMCVVAWTSLSLLQASGDMETTTWRKVLVEPTRFAPQVTQSPMTLGRTLCAAMCVEKGWCSMWCFATPTQCLLTSLIVSPSYIPTEPSGARFCYTTLRKDLAFGVLATSPNPDTRRPATHLVDGYYDNDLWSCAFVEPGGQWFQIDLGFNATVAEVVLMAPPGYAGDEFRDIEVRVGLSPMPSPGDFSTFSLFDTFAGPGVNDQTVVLRPAQPLRARYVSITRTTSGKLMIAHLEIR